LFGEGRRSEEIHRAFPCNSDIESDGITNFHGAWSCLTCNSVYTDRTAVILRPPLFGHRFDSDCFNLGFSNDRSHAGDCDLRSKIGKEITAKTTGTAEKIITECREWTTGASQFFRVVQNDPHVVSVNFAGSIRIDGGIDFVKQILTFLTLHVFSQGQFPFRNLTVLRHFSKGFLEVTPLGLLADQRPHGGFIEREVEFPIAIGSYPDLERQLQSFTDVDLIVFAFDFDEQ